MSETIKNEGGLTVRFIEALNGFKTKYGYWPERLEADAGTICALATSCLTPLGFFLLQSKLDVAEGMSDRILAMGHEGDAFDYGEEGWQGEHRHDARVWLGLDAAIAGPARSSQGERQHDQLTTGTFIPVFRARDQVLASEEAVKARRDRSLEPHVAPLQALAERIGASLDAPDGVPRFDPLDGGINARVLLLQEAPGPRAVGSGFVSFDNPDQTAANARHACESAGLLRQDAVRWNAVPWYLGNEEGTKIRPATPEDVKRAEPWLGELLRLLPRLQVVVLMGKNAQRLAPAINRLAPSLRVEKTSHCSPLALNYSPERRPALIEELRKVAASLRP
ncbi:uracil-DNA glycosylase [Variovorax rhizosphaerae]|uniref:Uracil-DNA glycosylase n=1 Tax=Variovorax rhizosphaerae TaxID=1836200 RepID=A0ABU8WEL2_9BURK